MGECRSAGTATVMILGNVCTRSCGSAPVSTGRPEEVDPYEPLRVAKSVKLMGLKHVVITSVDRDDLKDGGSEIWAKTVETIRKMNPALRRKRSFPTFRANGENLKRVIDVKPEIVSHNLETVRRLTREVRVQARYDRSFGSSETAERQRHHDQIGHYRLGLGESEEEILETMDDLRTVA